MAFKQNVAGRILGEIYMTVIATQGGDLSILGFAFRGQKSSRRGAGPVGTAVRLADGGRR